MRGSGAFRVRVALFVTCLTDTFFPHVGAAIVRVLRHFGCTVEFPEAQTCCGQPAFNSGFHAEAAVAARRMIEIFEPYEHVVTPSASCAAMVQHHYEELFQREPIWRQRAASLAKRTHEFTVFLRDVLKVGLAPLLRFDGDFTYHYPCHARGVYTLDDLHSMLATAGGEKLKTPKPADLCCGFGGAFAVEFAPVSGALLADKLGILRATGCDTVVCNEGGCTLHLAGGAHREGRPLRFVHLAEVLADSLGLTPRPEAQTRA
jgi:L-lactate dehydrogenase complex protein LldE